MKRTIDELLLGGIRFRSLSAGHMGLDGGSCFGAVPKSLWSGLAAADELNRVTLALRPVLIDKEGAKILVDAGLGDGVDERMRALLGYVGDPEDSRFTERAGVDPEEIDYVVFTHLHADHMGGAVGRENGNGRLRDRFPRARYVVQRGEWEDAAKPTFLTRPGYAAELVAVLEETGRLELVDGETDLLPGLRLLVTGGHTRRHQAVLVETGEGPVLIPGDLCPTALHLRPGWISALDLYRPESFESKEKLLRTVATNGGHLILYHETGAPIGRLEEPAARRFEMRAPAPHPGERQVGDRRR